ncbi:flagellin [Pseudomonas alloputida]|uniref:Flagellin n=1 Tax=Pseudomonas alloputida TaxID=1940621 RepID=A0AAW7HDJ7_9PSED|nr:MULTISPECIES: flagellin [Pseudomonas]MCE0975745.1 hypothetical protein [Pseudomonas putida]MCS8483401.1 flagellin [Pseudomonas aeruginosa]MCT1211400.1 flagellin [Pseudomonas aeruginosa]MDM3950805.1 flagellin [Pseudomonas alloputida]
MSAPRQVSRAPWGHDAISNLDSQRAQLGVVQNRLENIIANLQKKSARTARRHAAG